MQQLEQEVSQKAADINSKEEEIVRARLEITRSAREVEDLKKKMLTSEKAKEDLINDRTRYLITISCLFMYLTLFVYTFTVSNVLKCNHIENFSQSFKMCSGQSDQCLSFEI